MKTSKLNFKLLVRMLFSVESLNSMGIKHFLIACKNISRDRHIVIFHFHKSCPLFKDLSPPYSEWRKWYSHLKSSHIRRVCIADDKNRRIFVLSWQTCLLLLDMGNGEVYFTACGLISHQEISVTSDIILKFHQSQPTEYVPAKWLSEWVSGWVGR